MGTGVAHAEASARPLLVRRREEWRQVGIVTTYMGLLASMVLVPWCRNPVFFVAACYFSFLNAVVIHNHLHQGIFHSRALNKAWRCVLSFGALYPASTNIPAHNLVHHHFEDDGQPDWVDTHHVSFRWNLLNLLHFPNVVGPNTFAGLHRWRAFTKHPGFGRQLLLEVSVAFGLTLALLAWDFWTTFFFVVIPQVYGARSILRINLIQHDRTDTSSEWNHSRNFVGRAFNWIMCNNGYHTIHHNRAGLHWSDLDAAHDREVKSRIDPTLDEQSMFGYLARTYLLGIQRPAPRDVAAAEQGADDAGLAPREDRRAEAEASAALESAPV
jgi:fatty acid desaturase